MEKKIVHRYSDTVEPHLTFKNRPTLKAQKEKKNIFT